MKWRGGCRENGCGQGFEGYGCKLLISLKNIGHFIAVTIECGEYKAPPILEYGERRPVNPFPSFPCEGRIMVVWKRSSPQLPLSATTALAEAFMKHWYYKTMRKTMLTLLYFALNDRPTRQEDVEKIVKNESIGLSSNQIRNKIERMLDLGFIHRVNNEIKLTERGLFLIDKRKRTLENIMYSHVLKSAMDREEFKKIYDKLLIKITWQSTDRNTYMKPLRALKKRELIDFTKDRVWGGGKQIKLRRQKK